MRPITVTVGPLAAASANAIATSQTPTSGTALTIDGALAANGVATLDTPRQVLVTYGNEGAARSMVVTGTTFGGRSATETLTIPSGAGGTVATALDYATVTQLMPGGGGYTAAVTVGTNALAGSAWVRLDEWAMPQTTIQCVVSGTVDYTVQATLDDPNSPSNPVAIEDVVWSDSADTGAVGATGTILSYFAYAPIFARVLVNSGSGTVTATFVQSLVTPA